jgi:beta-N-acetylhexosaminidase
MPRATYAAALLVAVATCALAGCSASTAGSPVSGPPGPPGLSSPSAPTTAPTTPSATDPLTTAGGSSGPASTPPASSSSSAPPTSPSSPPTDPPPDSLVAHALAAMTEAQRVGQLLMVDCPSSGVASATATAIQRYHVGNVILDGTSTLSVTQTAAITSALQRLAPSTLGLFISTDQEGGEVQRMQGPGFTRIPSAVVQGGWTPTRLRKDASRWARQLQAAGINVDLAPVLDTVPANSPGNPPIGDLDREYGHTPSAVAEHGVPVAEGIDDGGVDATIKHFPGLGRVSGNTDTSSGVTDTVTTRHDAYLAPYADAVQAGVPFVMMSTAIYSRIDPGVPAAFSPTIVTGMLRGDLGFTGVIISDDLGAAAQVSSYPVGQRAVDFIEAGGDMALTVSAADAGPMTRALLAKAKSSPAFAAQVNAAVITVLEAKQARGLMR